MTITGIGPHIVDELPSFRAAFADPSGLGRVASGITVKVRKPDGTVFTDTGSTTADGTNAWIYTATQPIDQAGTWGWKVTTTGALIAADDWEAEVAEDRFS